MKKRLIGIVLAGAMTASVFTGCGAQAKAAMAAVETELAAVEMLERAEELPEPDNNVIVAEEAEDELVERVQEEKKQKEEPELEEELEQEEEPEQKKTKKRKVKPVVEEDLDAEESDPDEIEPVETTVDAPAQIGEWVETKQYSAADSEYHTIYYRVVDVERGDAAQTVVDRYNSEDHVSYFGELDDPDLEFCLLTYEVFFPEDFPSGDYGITSPDVEFTAKSPDGGGIKANGRAYIGLGMAYDVSEEVPINTLMPGDIWTGEAVFAMAKDFDEYVLETYYFEDDEQINSYAAGK